jgi:hypothetical protein
MSADARPVDPVEALEPEAEQDERVFNVLELDEAELLEVFPYGRPQEGVIYGLLAAAVLRDEATGQIVIPLKLAPIAVSKGAKAGAQIVTPANGGGRILVPK